MHLSFASLARSIAAAVPRDEGKTDTSHVCDCSAPAEPSVLALQGKRTTWLAGGSTAALPPLDPSLSPSMAGPDGLFVRALQRKRKGVSNHQILNKDTKHCAHVFVSARDNFRFRSEKPEPFFFSV